jgi:hypothetical protein
MPEPSTGWTIETLFYHFTRIVDDLGRRIDERVLAAEKAATLALGSSEKAIAKAEYASEKRFEGVNEFRGALSDASRNNITRAEVEKQFEAVTDKVKDLGDRLNRSEGRTLGHDQSKTDNNRNYALIISVVAGLIGLLSLVLAAIGLFIANYHKV